MSRRQVQFQYATCTEEAVLDLVDNGYLEATAEGTCGVSVAVWN
jgi:hypothetical protein